MWSLGCAVDSRIFFIFLYKWPIPFCVSGKHSHWSTDKPIRFDSCLPSFGSSPLSPVVPEQEIASSKSHQNENLREGEEGGRGKVWLLSGVTSEDRLAYHDEDALQEVAHVDNIMYDIMCWSISARFCRHAWNGKQVNDFTNIGRKVDYMALPSPVFSQRALASIAHNARRCTSFILELSIVSCSALSLFDDVVVTW